MLPLGAIVAVISGVVSILGGISQIGEAVKPDDKK